MQENHLIVKINTRDDITINGFHRILTDDECSWRVILWLYNQTITWTVFVFVMLCYILLLDMQGSNLNVFSMYINKHFYSWCKNTLLNFCKLLSKRWFFSVKTFLFVVSYSCIWHIESRQDEILIDLDKNCSCRYTFFMLFIVKHKSHTTYSARVFSFLSFVHIAHKIIWKIHLSIFTSMGLLKWLLNVGGLF